MDKLVKAVHIDSFRKNPYVNKELECVPVEKGNETGISQASYEFQFIINYSNTIWKFGY